MKISPRPRVSFCSFVCSRTVDTPTDKLSLYCGGLQQYPPPAAISSRLSHTRARLSVFSNFRPFWRLFSHNRYILTNLATFFEKTLAIVQLEFVSSNVTAPRVRDLTLPAQCRLLCVYSVQWVSGSEAALIWP